LLRIPSIGEKYRAPGRQQNSGAAREPAEVPHVRQVGDYKSIHLPPIQRRAQACLPSSKIHQDDCNRSKAKRASAEARWTAKCGAD